MRRTKRDIGAREFQEWQELHRIEPWGDDWLQAGTICATLVNLWTKLKAKPERFIPADRASQRKSAQQMEAEMMHFARLHNAVIDAKEKKAKGK